MSGHPVLLMVIGPPTAVAGTVAVMVVSLTTVKVATTLLLNLTPVTLPPVIKLTPVMVTISPILPTFGLTLLTAGQVSAGTTVKLASEMSKKIFPRPSILTRAVAEQHARNLQRVGAVVRAPGQLVVG